MRLLIVGASARAAAWSARRAGLEPFGIDLFGDQDLRALGESIRVEPGAYPSGLAEVAAGLGPGPWLYTGAIENHPELVDRISASRTLWGNPGSVLRAVRDPFAMTEALANARLPRARVWESSRGLPRDGSVLVKPRASAGGRGIRALGDGEEESASVYYQERLEGPSLGAVYLAERAGGPVTLAGLTEHWRGTGYGWRGCVGPCPISKPRQDEAVRLGAVLAEAFGLAGLFGVDLIESAGRLVPVEVNPRYSASVEVIERARGCSLLAAHRAAFEGGGFEGLPLAAGSSGSVVGKVIVWAPGALRAPALYGWRPVGEDGRPPRIADVPGEGERFRPGEPVLTLLQGASSVEACRARLGRRLAAWEARMRRPPWVEGEGG